MMNKIHQFLRNGNKDTVCGGKDRRSVNSTRAGGWCTSWHMDPKKRTESDRNDTVQFPVEFLLRFDLEV